MWVLTLSIEVLFEHNRGGIVQALLRKKLIFLFLALKTTFHWTWFEFWSLFCRTFIFYKERQKRLKIKKEERTVKENNNSSKVVNEEALANDCNMMWRSSIKQSATDKDTCIAILGTDSRDFFI